MKKFLFLILIPMLGFSQVQIGWTIYGEAVDDHSGSSVSISADGNIVAIGAPTNDGNGIGSGQVRVYQTAPGEWIQIGADIDGEIESISGKSVSLSADGNVVAVGAPYDESHSEQPGRVRIYRNISGNWIQVGTDINGETLGEKFGHSVALSSDGNTLAVSAPYYMVNDQVSGQVRIYRNISGAWTQIGASINGLPPNINAGRAFGENVSLSSDGNVLAIGNRFHYTTEGVPGAASIYRNIADNWTLIGSPIVGESPFERSAQFVSLSADGNVVAIAVPSGYPLPKSRVYHNISGVWTKIGSDIIGQGTQEDRPESIALSADGSVLVTGCPLANSVSGLVHVYHNISGNWTERGRIFGHASPIANGSSVALSADGNIVAIGAPNLGTNGCYTRVYDISSGALTSDAFVQSNFSIYPNPATDLVTIQLKENLQLEKISIYNTLGQLIKTEKNSIISITDLAKGTYFLEVETNKGKAAKSIIIE